MNSESHSLKLLIINEGSKSVVTKSFIKIASETETSVSTPKTKEHIIAICEIIGEGGRRS
jgi:hypothetical protein